MAKGTQGGGVTGELNRTRVERELEGTQGAGDPWWRGPRVEGDPGWRGPSCVEEDLEGIQGGGGTDQAIYPCDPALP